MTEYVQAQPTFPGMGMSLTEKVDLAVLTLKTYEASALALDPVNGYWLGFSGGKDSIVIHRLAELALVRFLAHYNVPTIDPPELVRHIRKHYPNVVRHRPEKALLTSLVNVGFPTRLNRWCCKDYKEGGGDGLFKVVGIRAAESPRRAAIWKPLMRWDAKRHGGSGADAWVLSPILAWSDEDVWEFIHSEDLPYCSLYDEGFKRLGCIGCPQARQGRRKQFARWPGYERAWRRAFHRLWAKRRGDVMKRGKYKGKQWPGMSDVSTPDELFEWWLSDSSSSVADDGSDCFAGFFSGGDSDA